MQEIAFLGAKEEEETVDEAEELLEVGVGGEATVKKPLAQCGIFLVRDEPGAKNAESVGDAGAQSVADADALGVALGFPHLPGGGGGSMKVEG